MIFICGSFTHCNNFISINNSKLTNKSGVCGNFKNVDVNAFSSKMNEEL